jgi:hypothetical protein
MSVLGQLVQRVQESRPEPDKPVLFNAKLSGDCVSRLEADTPDIVGEFVGILLYDLDRLRPMPTTATKSV